MTATELALMITLLLAWLLASAPMQKPEPKPVPKNSVEIATRGCLKGRVFTATPRPEDEGVVRGPDVTGRHFRLAGPKEVMDVVKQNSGNLVEVVGLVRKDDLANQGVGFNVPGGRVTVAAPPAGDPNQMTRPPVPTVPVMDVSSVRFLSSSCPLK